MLPNNAPRRRQYQSKPQKKQKCEKLQSAVKIEKKKKQLTDQLNQIVGEIGHIKKIAVCTQDPLIVKLENIQKQAKNYEFKEIMKIANLAIGKRILNLELQRKRAQIENKIQKKRQIEQYFRENRIKKTTYQQIALQKLNSNTFIVKPYSDGKAFIQSTIFYEKLISSITGKQYIQYLQQCHYLQTIKHINKIFFNNFSNSSSQQSRKQAINNPILRIGLILVFVLLSLCIYMGYSQNAVISYFVFIGTIILVILMVIFSFWNYHHDKPSKNQLDQTMLEINQYFKKINQENRKLGMRYQWICGNHFLYLEVKFDDLL